MEGGDAKGIAGTEGEKLPRAGFVEGVVNLVNDQHDGATTAQGPTGGVRVFIHHSRRHVNDKENEVGLSEGGVGLLGDL